MYYIELFIASCILCLLVQSEISNDVILWVGTEIRKETAKEREILFIAMGSWEVQLSVKCERLSFSETGINLIGYHAVCCVLFKGYWCVWFA